jgi:hypothetical protein
MPSSRTTLRMEVPTHVLVGSGIAVVISTSLVVCLITGLSRLEKPTATKKAEDARTHRAAGGALVCTR